MTTLFLDIREIPLQYDKKRAAEENLSSLATTTSLIESRKFRQNQSSTSLTAEASSTGPLLTRFGMHSQSMTGPLQETTVRFAM